MSKKLLGKLLKTSGTKKYPFTKNDFLYLYRDSDYDEYVVVDKANPDNNYYDPDKASAITTMAEMCKTL